MDKLTIDHVVPRSQGGVSSWTNCVLACMACKQAKGRPHAAGSRYDAAASASSADVETGLCQPPRAVGKLVEIRQRSVLEGGIGEVKEGGTDNLVRRKCDDGQDCPSHDYTSVLLGEQTGSGHRPKVGPVGPTGITPVDVRVRILALVLEEAVSYCLFALSQNARRLGASRPPVFWFLLHREVRFRNGHSNHE
jgi:HNH endonuclease